MNVVLLIPTGIGCEIGGHAGDANPVAKLIGACCDKLIIHPNVVNASDVNEMPDNALYVEGSILDRFLSGEIKLREVHQNKILVAVNSPVTADSINAINAGRATIGIDADIIELKTPLQMIATMENGCATGIVNGWQELIKQVAIYDFDALAIHTPITVDRQVALNYFQHGGVNPWGGVEAKASKLIATALNKPVAHAPIDTVTIDDKELYFIHEKIVDTRIAVEAISRCYLHCVLKGLHRAPRIENINGNGLSCNDIDFMLSPHGCIGIPHNACILNRIPVIVVKENTTVFSELNYRFTYVENYLEAAGLITAYRAGITAKSVQRPLSSVNVIKEK